MWNPNARTSRRRPETWSRGSPPPAAQRGRRGPCRVILCRAPPCSATRRGEISTYHFRSSQPMIFPPVLFCPAMPYCSTSHCTLLWCTALHCTALYCTILYHTALPYPTCMLCYATLRYATLQHTRSCSTAWYGMVHYHVVLDRTMPYCN